MDYFRVLLTAAGSLVALFLFTKLMGNRQISELNFFDYIVGISIGSIAAEMATNVDRNPAIGLIAMAVYAVISVILSKVTESSLVCRRFILGKTITLMSEGKLYEKNFKKAKVDINEFLIQSRANGYFDIDEVEYAFLESNGRITFLPKAENRPLTPKDSKITVKAERPFSLVVSDGKLLENNLNELGKDEKWLRSKLSKQSIGEMSTVFLACSDGENVRAYTKQNYKLENDMFQ
ncbi:MAG: DUF421 domain-containing protein [Eubacteriales bacterium]|nr:DUF421 domain-containing protein [Eubacteriales bacterium]